MELIGKLIKKLPEQSGESSRGHWVRMEFVIETSDQFPKQVCFSLWGEDKVSIVRNMQLGTETKVYFSPESREFNERWYTELKCFRLDAFNNITSNQTAIKGNTTNNSVPPISEVKQHGSFDNTVEVQEDDDLPF